MSHTATFLCKEPFTDGPREYVPGVLYVVPERKARELLRVHPRALEIQGNSIGPMRRDKMLHGWRI